MNNICDIKIENFKCKEEEMDLLIFRDGKSKEYLRCESTIIPLYENYDYSSPFECIVTKELFRHICVIHDGIIPNIKYIQTIDGIRHRIPKHNRRLVIKETNKNGDFICSLEKI